jgi:hypothetical protein
LDQHLKWAEDVAGQKIGEPGLLFVDLGVESPVLRFKAAGFGAAGEDDGGIGFGDED